MIGSEKEMHDLTSVITVFEHDGVRSSGTANRKRLTWREMRDTDRFESWR